eukprot:CAMPEP_0197243742 /NCGR_PEP_ID=MMETSP1429-20130617/9094_1 /TAXON_ID=49237 /ORGANISM="Chaetoceros  sp., Strain UNC1202" /LENGTH=514 /DNA_ID=CAMNT_0042704007 /DNA_START=10 /DNA_END=1551 /DNA_ORIENTATION=+
MIAFFTIAIRIELLLIDTCAIADNENTWNFVDRQSAFVVIVVWLVIFIITSASTASLFQYTGKSPRMVIAGALDVVLSVICLALFLRAEVERCCPEKRSTSNRFLAAADADSPEVCNPYHDSCPTFGTRLCGGIGNIEPLTSIIALRLFRFYIAKRILSIRKKCCGVGAGGGTEDAIAHESGDEKAISSEPSKEKAAHDPDNRQKPLDFEHHSGTIAQLWTAALLEYPDIVKNHGMFSGLLLEAMLGIESSPQADKQKQNEISGEELDQMELQRETPSSLRRKSMHKKQASSVSEANSFETVANDENERNFFRPGSALIRSMRRCQCKWLPLLDEWEIVDVVLTKYELVWFGSKFITGTWDEHIDRNRDTVMRALQTKKGGKGMRLCDVAVGRELLGRLPLCDIDEIKVQRAPPGINAFPTTKRKKTDVERGFGMENIIAEFWEDPDQHRAHQTENPNQRWNQVTEDVLVLHSRQGTLSLRFLVDLLDEEKVIQDKDQKSSECKFSMRQGALVW